MLLEGERDRRGPLAPKGALRTVQAGWLIPGGTIFDYELGLSGAARAAGAEAAFTSAVGLFGGGRLALSDPPWRFGLKPWIRGGLFLARLLVRGEGAVLGLGPYLAAGIEWEFMPRIALALSATLDAEVAPFALAAGGGVTLLFRPAP